MKFTRLLSLLMAIAFTSLGGVYILFEKTSPSNHLNGFDRKINVNRLIAIDTLPIRFNSFYIAGSTDHQLYLGNITAPLYLLTIDIHSFDTSHIALNLNDANPQNHHSLKVQVDSPYVFLGDGSTGSIFRGRLDSHTASSVTKEKIFFLDFAVINETTVVIGTLNKARDRTLALLKINPLEVRTSPSLLQKQVDGVFCTHGWLNIDTKTKHLVYVYAYRNEYFVTDSTLNLLFRGTTIDTVSIAPIKIGTIHSKKTRTFSAPAETTNRQSAVYDQLLFVNSSLQADNERREVFHHSSVIDVYDLVNNQYQNSFYVPHYNEEELQYFRVIGNTLLAVYPHDVVSYDLTPLNLTR